MERKQRIYICYQCTKPTRFWRNLRSVKLKQMLSPVLEDEYVATILVGTELNEIERVIHSSTMGECVLNVNTGMGLINLKKFIMDNYTIQGFVLCVTSLCTIRVT